MYFRVDFHAILYIKCSGDRNDTLLVEWLVYRPMYNVTCLWGFVCYFSVWQRHTMYNLHLPTNVKWVYVESASFTYHTKKT